MNCRSVSEYIIEWLREKNKEAELKGFIIGISGGVDSAVTSALCSKTNLPVECVSMPILQEPDQYSLPKMQIKWLKNKFRYVKCYTIDLTNAFNEFRNTLPNEAKTELALANSRSRLRMMTLYSFANSKSLLVCGTGNKVEDYGIGFFTKYGDGGVDLNPIGDLLKSEVYKLAAYLGIPKTIQKVAPTDGLWEYDKTDAEQIGATYDELEWAMDYLKVNKVCAYSNIVNVIGLSDRERKVLKIYLNRHNSTRHKLMIPHKCELNEIK